MDKNEAPQRENFGLARAPQQKSAKTATPRCTGRTKADKPCHAPVTDGDTCVMHSTRYSAAEKNAWRRRGQQASVKKQFPEPFERVNFEDPRSVQEMLEVVTQRVLNGRLPVSVARTAASLANAAAKLGDLRLSERIAQMEERLNKGPRR